MINELNEKLIKIQMEVERNKYEKEILENECDRLIKELNKYKTIENVLYNIAIIVISIVIGIVLCCFVK